MNDNSVILDDISTLAQICHATSDGPTLKIEESEIKNKLVAYDEEIEEIKELDADDSYDTSAEMADRNIEIITKKVIQSTNNELKNKNLEMEELKEKEAEYSNSLYGLKRTRKSYEKYIASLKERLTSATEDSITERYNSIIANTENKLFKQDEKIKEVEDKHSEIQKEMDNLYLEISNLENRLETKKTLLAEAQNNLETKDLYIDKAKKEKTTKRIAEIEEKKEELNKRLTEIYKDPKYLESKIKEILTNGSDTFEARNYLVELLSAAAKVPYADQYVDKKMEEELLDATQQRDTFASEIDSKTYDIMETVSPEQIRVEFLNERIAYWQSEIKRLEEKVAKIDKDEMFNYAEKAKTLEELITKLKEETQEFKTRYEKESESNLSNKAILKITYEEKRADLAAAEEISSKFRKNEASDVEEAGRIVRQDIDELNKFIALDEDEIAKIKDRINNRKSGNKDLSAKNRDREKLEELAQKVIDIKHRRQFGDRTFDIAKRLETNLDMKLVDAVYSAEEQDRLSKEVMIPIEEPVVEDPETVEIPEPEIEIEPEEEPVSEEETAIEEQPNLEVAIAEPAVDNTTEEVPEEDTSEVTEEIPVITEDTSNENTEETATEESEIEEVPIEDVTSEEPVSEDNTEEEISNEDQNIVPEEGNDGIINIEIPSIEESVEETPVEEKTIDIPIEEPVEEQQLDIPVVDAPVEVPSIDIPAEVPTEESSIDIPVEVPSEDTQVEIPTEIPTEDTPPDIPVEENNEMDIRIPDNIPMDFSITDNIITPIIPEDPPALEENPPVIDIPSMDQEEVVIPEEPPIPNISIDDTTSIPVIPIAEPSTDDNFTFNTESDANPFEESNNNENPSESGIE